MQLVKMITVNAVFHSKALKMSILVIASAKRLCENFHQHNSDGCHQIILHGASNIFTDNEFVSLMTLVIPKVVFKHMHIIVCGNF